MGKNSKLYFKMLCADIQLSVLKFKITDYLLKLDSLSAPK